MPIKMEIFHPDRLVLAVAEGEVSAAEYVKFLADIVQANVLHYRKLIQVAGATSSALGEAELLAFDARFRQLSTRKRGPIAIVTDRARGDIARAFKATTSTDRPVEVFGSIYDARQWLAKIPVGDP